MSGAIVFQYVSAIGCAALAVVTAVRAGRAVSRWSFAVGMLVLAAESLLNAFTQSTHSASDILRLQTWRLLVMAAIPGIWLLFSLSYARSAGRTLLVRGYAAVLAIGVAPIALALWFRDELADSVQQNLAGTDWILRLGFAGTVLFVVMLMGAVAVVVNVERTFRASVGTMRWRIKFMLLGVGMFFVVRIYTASQVLLFRGIESSMETINSAALILAALLMLRSMFRTGHFELEVYPSQSVLQNSLTILVAGAYLVIVGILAKVVTYIGGDAAFAPKAFLVLVALVLLALFLQSDRARLELRQFISRNFHRSPYDYRAVWRTFTDGTASKVEQSGLCHELARLTAELFHALSVSIVLLDEKKEALVIAASTASATVDAGKSEASHRAEVTAMQLHFKQHPEPLDLEAATDAWAVALKQCHPTQFANGGSRICVPLIGRGEFLGVMIVGDRVAGVPFSFEDLDMLKCIADHSAASLLNIQLSTKLLQAKELEAFQAMAAFFVHDLKNSASTLNLMLQNLPVHYADPEFREDALRGIAKTVAHINRLIGRLGSLRHELKIEATEADLNEVVGSVLAGIERSSSYTLTKDLKPLPKAFLDRDQIHKVITNLVLNAAEAVPPQGEIRVGTEQENGWAVVAVADNGCGMSREFLSQSLFRPFQTTKKNGLGIGMFQSKMIVEAHGGKIAVTSEPGKGTTFRVFLRVQAPR